VKHLDRKYFSYRGSNVAAAAAQYPDRAAILMASEYLRLGFIGVGSLLCAAIFGVLAWTAASRVGWLDWRTPTFGVLAVMAAAVALRVAGGFLDARRRKRKQSLKDCCRSNETLTTP
jgi:hypothetical protein